MCCIELYLKHTLHLGCEHHSVKALMFSLHVYKQSVLYCSVLRSYVTFSWESTLLYRNVYTTYVTFEQSLLRAPMPIRIQFCVNIIKYWYNIVTVLQCAHSICYIWVESLPERLPVRERRSRWGYNPSISVTASQLQPSSSLLTLAHCYCGRQTLHCWNKSFTTDENSVWISKLLPSVGNIKLLNWLKPEQKPTAVGNGLKKTFKISLLRCKTNIPNWKA